jgi:hypothetical protein
MKLSKIASVALISSAAFLIGCGGGGSSSGEQNATVSEKNVTIKAADAYVVSLPTPATLTIGNEEFNTTNVNNGTITFYNTK